MNAQASASKPLRPCWLYRLYDEAGELLYVGIAFDVQVRLTRHRIEKDWWPQVAEVRSVRYANQDEAMDAEVLAIEEEQPAHNGRLTRWRPRRDAATPGTRTQFSLRLPDELRERLDRLAEAEHRSLHSLIVHVLSIYAGEQERQR